MNKHFRTAVLWFDETVSLAYVKPLYSPDRQANLPLRINLKLLIYFIPRQQKKSGGNGGPSCSIGNLLSEILRVVPFEGS
jgi:hypothetical protein